MIIHTCSGAISLAKELETKSSQFYESLSQKFTKEKDLFSSLAKENQGYITEIERVYYGVITDAFEGCFSFHLNPEEYHFQTDLDEKTGYSEALAKSIEIEERIMKFYADAAEQSKSLMADVPRAFKMITKKRNHRLRTLRSLQEEKG